MPTAKPHHRDHPTSADEQERSGAEEWRGQQAAEEVVEPEGCIAPAGRGAPGKCRGGTGIREERSRPQRQLGCPTGAPATGEAAGEAQRQQRGGEGE